MRVLYFHQHFSTPAGSTSIRSYEMARALIKAGHEVTMVCGNYHGGKTGLQGPFQKGIRTGTVDGIGIIEFELPYSNYQGFIQRTVVFLKFALRSIRIALFKPSDLIFATSTPLTAGIPGIFARWLRRKTFVFEVRDLWPDLPKAMGVIKNPLVLLAMSLLEWASYNSANACIGLSPGIVKGIKKRSRPGKPVELIPNGCDFELFSKLNTTPKRPNGVGPDDFMAVFTGAHGMANGLDAVLDAAEVLKQRGRKDIKLVFIGDGKLKPRLIDRAKQNDLRNCIFIDPVQKDVLVKYLAGADLGLMILANIPAFYYGTSPNKFFDYLAMSLPVLNNYPGWIADMITEYKCGYVVDPENPEQFADALEHAANNRDELLKMGKRAQALGRKKFDRKRLAAQFVSWLERAEAMKYG